MKHYLTLLFILLIAGCLRLYQLDANPPGFYSDEASWSYNAYSLMLTGRDEYGRFLPWVFEAFGDYKLPVTVYSIIPSFLLFGVSDWSARLPTAIYGVLSVLALYLLVQELQSLGPQRQIITATKSSHQSSNQHKQLSSKRSVDSDHSNLLPQLTALLLAITPAHIFLSRGIWDIQSALFFVLCGVIFFLKAINKIEHNLRLLPTIYLLLSSAAFVLSMYSYNSARVVSPLLIILLTCIFWRPLLRTIRPRSWTVLALPLFVGVLLLAPQLKSITDPSVLQRARSVSIFNRGDVEAKIFGATSADGSDQPLLLIRFLHNKPVFYASEITQRYLQHFNLNYLFLTGDTFEIFKVEGIGVLPLVTLPFFFLGLLTVISKPHPTSYLILGWLVISPIPSALTVFTPSVSRAHNMIVPLVIIIAYGANTLSQIISRIHPSTNKVSIARGYWLTTFLILFTNVIYWFSQYFILTPVKVAHKWGSGWSEVSQYLVQNQTSFDQIYISNAQGPSYIWLAWYQRLDPQLVWQTRQTDFNPDTNGLNNTYQLAQYRFTKDITTDCVLPQKTVPTLCIGFGHEIKQPTIQILTSNGLPAFDLLRK